TATQKLNPRSDAPSAAQTIHTTNHRQLASALQAVCPPAIKKLCPRLAFDSTSLTHYRKKKKKKSPLSQVLCNLLDLFRRCIIFFDCVSHSVIAFCLRNIFLIFGKVIFLMCNYLCVLSDTSLLHESTIYGQLCIWFLFRTSIFSDFKNAFSIICHSREVR
uniref:Ovule protein n=1 Tax=Mesocestoides corti TaxID=53468 RepID=A0A5K3EVP6_MESCO